MIAHSYTRWRATSRTLEDTAAEEYDARVLAALPTARTSFLPDTTTGVLNHHAGTRDFMELVALFDIRALGSTRSGA
jgi:hypothetical protein